MRKPTVLIADDEPSVREHVSRALSSRAIDVVAVGDGDAALAAAGRDPDLVILDVNMPRLNGLEVLRHMRRAPRTRSIPVLMLTSQAEVDDRVAGLETGADDFLAKPFALEELRARVERLLKRQAAHPLTRLLGSPGIQEEVEKRLDIGERFGFMHIDIDDFKAYNDAYGFAAGDEVLRLTGRLLERVAGHGFAGHIGGDDFVLVCDLPVVPQAVAALCRDFDLAAPAFYTPLDRERGWIQTKDEVGTVRRFPLVSLSVGITMRKAGCYAEIAEAASQMKGHLKTQPPSGCSRWALDRLGSA